MIPDLFFIVDGPKLTAQAHLLTASILTHMAGTCRVFAYSRREDPLPETLQLLFEKARVTRRVIPGLDPDPWSRPYPIGNKILAMGDDRGGEISVFLDTDTVFHAPVDFIATLGPADMAAVLSDYRAALPDSAAWQPIYDHFKTPMPQDRPGTLKRPGMDYPPYFNAGMIICRNRPAGLAASFGQAWLEMALSLDHGFRVDELHENIDQITLSVLGARDEVASVTLSNRLNYNVMGWGAPVPGGCAIAHYHVFGKLWRLPSVGGPVIAALQEHLGADGFRSFLEEFGPLMQRRKLKLMMREAGLPIP
ncbi:hypothetical protein SAMN05421538_106242 [Paracoccus isoporae]|uniref:Nucleotide-diphospho-sugar transferase n=1 Tax=Paracoccus isoporae TaxID=591205 RepID=A0A1G7CXS9_9RHOB|nr:hypothetical protein [Paracoccus isoporae]SDE44033.1 hypothetical protein SAMN05421538_106242 [Paracoccus isoporae]